LSRATASCCGLLSSDCKKNWNCSLLSNITIFDNNEVSKALAI
jgi:hypothetical protein